MPFFSFFAALAGAFLLVLPAHAGTARSIVVVGHASVDVDPDVAYLSMGIQALDSEISAASASVAARVAALLELTRELGIPDAQVSTAAAEVRPQYDYDGRREEGPRLIGYVVRRQLSIRLDDIERIGRLTEGVLRVGVNDLSPARFDTRRRGELEREALAIAVRDAKDRAEAIAAAAGVRIGSPRRLSAQPVRVPGPLAMRAEAMAVPAEETYQPGRIRIEASVEADYELLTGQEPVE